MSIDVIIAGWQETFKSAASRLAGDFRVSARQLAADLNVSCQPAGRRHFLFLNIYIFLFYYVSPSMEETDGLS